MFRFTVFRSSRREVTDKGRLPFDVDYGGPYRAIACQPSITNAAADGVVHQGEPNVVTSLADPSSEERTAADQSTAETRILLELAMLVHDGKSFDDIFAVFAREVVGIAYFDFASLILREDDKTARLACMYPDDVITGLGDVRPQAYWGMDAVGDTPEGIQYLTADVGAGAVPLLVNGGIKRAFTVPLRAGDDYLGLLTVGRLKDSRFTRNERAFIVAACRILVTALRNGKLVARLERESLREESLHRLAVLLNGSVPLSEVFDEVRETIGRAIAFDSLVLIVQMIDPAWMSRVGVYSTRGDLDIPGLVRTDRVRSLDTTPGAPTVTQGPVEPGASDGQQRLAAAGYTWRATVGLRDENRQQGRMLFGRAAAVPFSDEDVRFMEMAGVILSRSIAARLRMEEATQEILRERLISEISLVVQSGAAPETVFEHARSAFLEELGFSYISAFARQPSTLMFRSIGAEPALRYETGVLTTRSDAGVTLLESQGASGAIQFKTTDVDHVAVNLLRVRGIRRGVAMLLRHGVDVVGILTAGKESRARFSDADVRFLERIGSLVAQSIDNEIQSHRAAVEVARGIVLNQISLMVNAGESISDSFLAIEETLRRAIDFDWLGIFFREPMGDEFSARTTSNPQSQDRSTQLVLDAIKTLQANGVYRRQTRTKGEQDFPGVGALRLMGMSRVMAVMMNRTEQALGFIVVARREDLRFDDSEMNFLEVVSQLLGQSVANHVRLQRARTEAARNGLLNELSVLLNAGEPVEALFSRFESLLYQGAGLASCVLLTRQVRGDVLNLIMSGEVIPPSSPFTLQNSGIQEMVDDGLGTQQFRTGDAPFRGADKLRDSGFKRAVAAVMQQSGELLGMLVVARDEETPFDTDEMAFIELASTLLGQAVANQLRIERARESAARSQTLNELSILVNAGEPVAAVFDQFERLLNQGVTGLVWCALLFREGDDDRLLALESGNRSILGGRQTVISAGIPLVMQEGGGVVQFSTTFDGPRARYLRKFALERVANAVMRRGDEVYGMVMVARDEDTEFDPEEVRFIEVAAALIGQAVANQIQVRRARSETARSQLLNEMAILLNAGGTIEAAFERLAGLMAEALPFDYISAVSSDNPDGPFRVIGRYPHALTDDDAIPYEETGIEGLKRMRRRVFQARTSDLLSEKRAQLMLSHGYRRVGVTALTAGDQWLGSMLVGRIEDTPFSTLELQFLDVMSVLLGQAITNQGQILRARAEAARNQLLNQLAILLNAGEEVEVVFERLAGMMSFALPFDFLAVAADSEDAPSGLRIIGAFPPAMTAVHDMPFDRDAIRMLRGANMRFNQFLLTTLNGQAAQLAASKGMQRAGIVLLKDGDEDIGLMVMLRNSEARFSDDEARFLEVVGVLVGQAVANRSRLHRSEEDAAEQRMLAHAAGLAASSATTVDMLAGLTEALALLVPQVEVTIGYIDGNAVEYRSHQGKADWPLTDRIRTAIASGQLAYTDEDAVVTREWDNRIRAFTITVAESSGLKPMLIIGSKEAGYQFPARTLRLLRMLTNILGSSMVNMRQAESMAHERAQYELVLKSLSEAVLILNDDMVAEYVNPAGQPIVESLAGAWRTVAIDGRLSLTPPAAADALRRAMVTREAAHGRAPLPVKGEQRWFDFEVTPFGAPDRRILLVAEDVTLEVEQEEEAARQRERMEQASRLAALGELIGGVAHELNNPLTAILGFAEFLTASGAGAEDAEIIKKEALRARDIVRDLLFIARPGKVEQEPLHVADLVPHVDRLRRTSWASAGIKVTWSIAEQSGPVMGNEHQLTQVLLNLVTNAEHALEGVESPAIAVSVFVEGEDVVLTVRDNGTGMDEETRRRVFEPFFTTKQGHGTGLGLPLSYSIIAAHRGRIELESEPGKGTCFMVRLPVVAGGELRRDEATEIESNSESVKVLVIDDEPNLRKVCQRLITSLGSECAVAATGQEGLRLALESDYDLILCDYRLANDTAATVVDGLAKSAPGRVERVVIATGATTDPGVVLLTEKYNLRLVAKPYGHAEITALIRAAAEQSAARA